MAVFDKKILHTVFDATAEKFPDNVAVEKGAQKITYKALKNASDKIACQLRSAGVKNETIVGVVLQSSIEYVAAIIGVLKANGVFLPLDMNFPDNRLEYMLGNSVPEVILTDKKHRDDILCRFNGFD